MGPDQEDTLGHSLDPTLAGPRKERDKLDSGFRDKERLECVADVLSYNYNHNFLAQWSCIMAMKASYSRQASSMNAMSFVSVGSCDAFTSLNAAKNTSSVYPQACTASNRNYRGSGLLSICDSNRVWNSL